MRYLFDCISIDDENYVLSVGGENLAAEPLIFDLLLCLLKQPNQLVTKDALLESVWQGRFVADSTIASAIKEARKLLGDDGHRQHYIETVRGRGFRFKAPADFRQQEPVATGLDAFVTPANFLADSRQYQQCEPTLQLLPYSYSLFEDADASRLRACFEHFQIELQRLLQRIPLLKILSFTEADRRAVDSSALACFQLEGNVSQFEDELSISLSLKDLNSGFLLWSDSYGYPPEALLVKHNDALLIKVIKQLEPQLNSAIYSSVIHSQGQKSAKALYLQARALLAIKGWCESTFAEAAGLLRQSIHLSSDFALAKAQLGLLLAFGHRIGISMGAGRAAIIAEAAQMADEALDAEPNDSTILGLSGCTYCDLDRPERGAPLLEKALQLNKDNAQARVARGAHRLLNGEVDSAISDLKQGIELSPLDPRLAIWQSLLAIAYLASKDINSAVAAATGACENNHHSFIPYVVLASACLACQQRQKAERMFAEARRAKPDLQIEHIAALLGRRQANLLLDVCQLSAL